MSKLIVEEVRLRRLDGGFAYIGEALVGQQAEELTGLRLASTTLHVVCPPSWAARLADCTWEDAAEEPWVWYSDNCPCRPPALAASGPLARRISKVPSPIPRGT
jgi:DNA-binding transcriptional LysR family regulator